MGSHSKCRGGRGPCWPRLPPGQGSLPRLSGLRSPPKCPTSFALFMPSSLVLAGPRCMTLRRTLHLWGWTALWQHAAAPRLVQCPRALRAARSVVGHLFAPAPRSLIQAAVATPLPCPAISVPLPSGQREHDAEQFARQRSLSAISLPRPPGPVPPPVRSPSLVLPCPPSQAPWSLALCLPVPVLPLSPRHRLRGAKREASLPLPLHLATPWCPCPLACGTHVALHPPATFVPLRPPCLPLPPLPFSVSDTTHCVGKLHACRRHAPVRYRRRRRAGWHQAVAAHRCHSPRRSRRRGQPLQMPRGARPW